MEDKLLIPVLYENTNTPLLLETVSDVTFALETCQFIKGGTHVKNRNIISEFVKNCEEPITVNCSFSDKVKDLFPAEMWDKVRCTDSYFKSNVDKPCISMDLDNTKSMTQALADAVNRQALSIHERYKNNELCYEELREEWSELCDTVKQCDSSISSNGFGPITLELSLLSDFMYLYCSSNDKEKSHKEVIPLCTYLVGKLKFVDKCGLLLCDTFDALYEDCDDINIKDGLGKICNSIFNGEKCPVIESEVPELKLTTNLDSITNVNRSLLKMSGLTLSSPVQQCCTSGNENLMAIDGELSGESVDISNIKYGSSLDLATMEDLFEAGLLDKNNIFSCDLLDDTAYIRSHYNVCSLLVKSKKTNAILSLCLANTEGLMGTVQNLKGCGDTSLAIYGVVHDPKTAVEESASVNIDSDGTMRIEKNVFESNPMDNYANIHQQIVIANKSQSAEDMKVLLAVILHNSLDYERLYYKMKRKGNTKKIKQYEKARMFFKNDFAQYYPRYLEMADENDFLQYYRDSGLGVKEYSISTDNISGVKKIIKSIIR